MRDISAHSCCLGTFLMFAGFLEIGIPCLSLAITLVLDLDTLYMVPVVELYKPPVMKKIFC